MRPTHKLGPYARPVSFRDLFPQAGRELVDVRGDDVLRRLGPDGIFDVVGDILCGANVRAVTEAYTRTRVTLLSAALLKTYVLAKAADSSLPAGLAGTLAHERTQRPLSKEHRWLLQWGLGLTDKQFQNVLRSDQEALSDYADTFESVLSQAADAARQAHGELSGELTIEGTRAEMDWPTALALMTAIGQAALTIRGSEKSLYGKLFEKLVLAGVLHVLGFEYCEREVKPEAGKNLFWLASEKERRESDATALVSDDVAIRFDIGFIGTGNPEILLDKISRFERMIELEGENVDALPFVVGDSIAENSSIVALAQDIGGVIVEMRKENWPVFLAEQIAAVSSYESPFSDDREPEDVIRESLKTAPFGEMFEIAAEVAVSESD